jgi:hypothetical protein
MRWGDAQTLKKMEGLLQTLRDQPPEQRPEQMVNVYLANMFGVSPRTMLQRLADAETNAGRDSLADYFCDLWRQIANVLGEAIHATVFKIAKDAGNRNAFNAGKWLAERNEPDVFGTQREAATHRDVGGAMSDIEQEVFDEMDATETLQLEEIERNIGGEMTKLGALVRRIRKRLAEKAVLHDVGDDDD